MSDPNDTQPDDVPVEGKTLDNGEPVAPAAGSPVSGGPAAAGPAANKAKGSNLQDLVVAVQPAVEPVVGAPPEALAQLSIVLAPLTGCSKKSHAGA